MQARLIPAGPAGGRVTGYDRLDPAWSRRQGNARAADTGTGGPDRLGSGRHRAQPESFDVGYQRTGRLIEVDHRDRPPRRDETEYRRCVRDPVAYDDPHPLAGPDPARVNA
ncbi:hypothetical protein [Nocardia carnea]|uniref:hypothetical protein n=1 Tax=Nocardia carnea TaxID=37328 RepID=UPI0024570BA5|nr:hypothetical protein [Nocardia carnea]